MSQRIVIDNVTRIEGHAKITIQLNDQGIVEDAWFHVTQFRGFEKMCEGRPYTEMPSLMARICGICPVSHLMASAKACDDLLAIEIPKTASNLRRIMNFAQIVQSHALSFFYLSAPDFVMGMDADPAVRNIVGVLKENPSVAKDGVRLRSMGQQIIELLGGKRIHPAWAVPGGVSRPLSEEHRDKILAFMPECLAITQRTLTWFKEVQAKYKEEVQTFGNFPSLFMGLVTPEGELEHYDGVLRMVDASGNVISDNLDPRTYPSFISEKVEPFSYLKSPYYAPFGPEDGMYRVGPLARLNLVKRCGTPLADKELLVFQQQQKLVNLSSFYFHHARLVEILYCIEKTKELLEDPSILDPNVLAHARPSRREGFGVSEAPRGTLMHHYRVNKFGKMESANLIIATGHNNLAMNRSVMQVARHYIKGAKVPEGILNRVEAVIRTYDPCLSCSTHAVGKMPLDISLLSKQGDVLDRLVR